MYKKLYIKCESCLAAWLRGGFWANCSGERGLPRRSHAALKRGAAWLCAGYTLRVFDIICVIAWCVVLSIDLQFVFSHAPKTFITPRKLSIIPDRLSKVPNKIKTVTNRQCLQAFPALCRTLSIVRHSNCAPPQGTLQNTHCYLLAGLSEEMGINCDLCCVLA